MSILHCIFLSALLCLQCAARNRNPSLDKVRGPWVVRNASENALPHIGDCPSVELEPPPKKSLDRKGTILFSTEETTYTLTIVEMDKSTYQIFNSESFPLGNLSILTVETDTFLVAQVKAQEEIYYAVLTNEDKTSDKVDEKIKKFWNSSDSTKKVSLFPINQENCVTLSDDDEADNSVSITSTTTEDALIADAVSENNQSISHSDSPMQNASSESNHQSDDITASTPELRWKNITEIRPYIIKLDKNTDSMTSADTSNPTTVTETVSPPLPPEQKEDDNSIIIEPNISSRIVPDFILIYTILLLFFNL